MLRKVDTGLEAEKDRFRTYYSEKLCGDYVGLEPIRKKYLRQFGVRMAVGFVAAGLYYACCVMRNVSAEVIFSNNVLGIYVVFISFFGLWARKPCVWYQKDSKRLVMDKILAFWGDVHYSASSESDIPAEDLRKSGLFGNFEDRKAADEFKGVYKGAEVIVSEQCLTRTVHMREGSREAMVFNGIVIKLKLAKKIAGQTVVRSDRGWFNFMISALRGGRKEFANGTVVESIFIKSMQQNVKLKDPVFEREWEVYATDQIEARYILTPALMERMLEIKRRFGGKSIEFSFFDNQALIAVRTNKDMFETTSLFTPSLSYCRVQEVVAQFYSIFSAIGLLQGAEYEREVSVQQ